MRRRFPMKLLIRIVGALLILVEPILAFVYRLSPARCPSIITYALGIATVEHRKGFYTLDRIVRSTGRFDGAIIECGTYSGQTLLGMAHLLSLRSINVHLYGLDSFEGFPKPTEQDALPDGSFHPAVQKGHFKDVSYERLIKKIARLGFADRITLVRGFFQDTLPSLKDENFSLVHLDCDLYQSYKTCLKFLYQQVLRGGFIVFDEYDEPAYPGGKKAIDEFFLSKPEEIQRYAECVQPRYFIQKQ